MGLGVRAAHVSSSAQFAKRLHVDFTKDKQQDVFEAGHTYIFLANNGKYVSRIRRGEVDHIEAEKTSMDLYCRFRTSVMGNGKVAFRGDDGDWHYLSRIDRGAQNIEAAKGVVDKFSEFEVEVATPGPWNRARYVYLKADNGKSLGTVSDGSIISLLASSRRSAQHLACSSSSLASSRDTAAVL